MSATILEQLAAAARERVAATLRQTPAGVLAARAEEAADAQRRGGSARPTPADLPFEAALRTGASRDIAFICEVKRASPSKGLIAPEFPYLDIAADYEAAGADAVSVLTEPRWFLGSDEYLREIAAGVGVPALRKDFTVHQAMIDEAKLLGASAVLLICSILSDAELLAFRERAERLGLTALVEAHTPEEVRRALGAGARVLGVNNRNLADFSVDTSNAGRLREMVPADVVFVSESGVHGPADVQAARDMGADAVLVGEAMMRAADKRAKLAELRAPVRRDESTVQEAQA